MKMRKCHYSATYLQVCPPAARGRTLFCEPSQTTITLRPSSVPLLVSLLVPLFVPLPCPPSLSPRLNSTNGWRRSTVRSFSTGPLVPPVSRLTRLHSTRVALLSPCDMQPRPSSTSFASTLESSSTRMCVVRLPRPSLSHRCLHTITRGGDPSRRRPVQG
jgi:hypothetical protein